MQRALLITIGLLALAGCGDDSVSEAAKGPRGLPTQAGVSTSPGSVDDGPAAFANYMTVQAGEVRLVSSGLQGDFEIRQPSADEVSIAQPGLGGACLVAHVDGVSGHCRSDAQCADRFGTLKSTVPGNKGYAYCIGQTSGDVPAATCWIKPDESYCEKQKGEGKHTTPVVDPSAVRRFAGSAREIRWMVVGCLNGPRVPVPPEVPQDVRDRLPDPAPPCLLRGYTVPRGKVMYDTGPSFPPIVPGPPIQP